VHDGLAIWDTLAIAEYVAENADALRGQHGAALWPTDRAARARARSICAEMHSGFSALRSACPMNIEAYLPAVGALAWRDKPAVVADVQRIVSMWSELLSEHGGPMLFGDFTVADAYYAPVCMRLRTYGLPVPAHISAYIERVVALPGVAAWIAGGLAEREFLDFEEPYRLRRDTELGPWATA
jgi:glutathione S-transferase